MESLPLFHRLADRTCLLVGGGRVAARKLRLLLAAGARVRLVALELAEETRALAGGERVAVSLREFAEQDLEGVVLAVAATGEPAVNARVARLAGERGIPVNVVDDPELSTVYFPAIVDRDPVQVAIGTGGAAPVLARSLRTQIEALLPGRLGDLARLAREFRDRVRARFSREAERRAFWEQVLEGPVAERALAGNLEDARARLAEALEKGAPPAGGEVYLVGAGPGDPDLLTLRALRLMQKADVVLYDRLVSPQVLDLVRRDAERFYVGKRAGEHPVTQENINRILVELAREGKRVLRLKGGDPFIFGRGGEEIEHLAAAGIPFQVVPGITAATGCAAYAGIPLTHRDYAQSVRFVAGHRRGDRIDLDWPSLVAPGQTLVFYMGLAGLEIIARELIAHGMDPQTPAALVEHGTLADQQVIVAPLADLPERVRAAGARPPTLLIVGEVVRLYPRLSWYRPAPGALLE
ncbi:MAG: siroheme synthase [Porticoccaceae bacterium]|nr:MAG: siroheme synthase [Porticoccaceae bacterium]